MTIMKRLEYNEDKDLFCNKFPQPMQINSEERNIINSYVQKYIRRKLENINESSAEYLYPLSGFLDDQSLEIFTLNYDGVIDLFCEKLEIKYIDGFTPFWNPLAFEDDYELKIYRLHGSLYWFKNTSGKTIRIPVKGLEIDESKYISDQPLSELIIYPTLQKEKFSEVYKWLSNRFISTLLSSNFLVVIGYSFRDDDITMNIKQALENNSQLWIIIVSPNSHDIKRKFLEIDDVSVSSRIISIGMGIEKVLNNGNLYRFIKILESTVDRENSLWKIQYQNSAPMGNGIM